MGGGFGYGGGCRWEAYYWAGHGFARGGEPAVLRLGMSF